MAACYQPKSGTDGTLLSDTTPKIRMPHWLLIESLLLHVLTRCTILLVLEPPVWQGSADTKALCLLEGRRTLSVHHQGSSLRGIGAENTRWRGVHDSLRRPVLRGLKILLDLRERSIGSHHSLAHRWFRHTLPHDLLFLLFLSHHCQPDFSLSWFVNVVDVYQVAERLFKIALWILIARCSDRQCIHREGDSTVGAVRLWCSRCGFVAFGHGCLRCGSAVGWRLVCSHDGIGQVLVCNGRGRFGCKWVVHRRRVEAKNIRRRRRSRSGRNRRWAVKGSRWLRRRTAVHGSSRRRACIYGGRRGSCSCSCSCRGLWCLVVTGGSYRRHDGPISIAWRSGCGRTRIGWWRRRLESLVVNRWSAVITRHGSRIRRRGCVRRWSRPGRTTSESQQIVGGSGRSSGRPSAGNLSQVTPTLIDGLFDGSAQIRVFLFPGQRSIILEILKASARRHSPASSVGPRWGLGWKGSLDAELEDPGHGEEGLAIDRQFVLAESVLHRHGRSCVAAHFDDVISLGLPAVFQHSRPVGGVVNFLSVHHELTLPGCDRPHKGHVVLLTAAISSVQTVCQGLLVGKPEAPSDLSFGRRNSLSSCDGVEVYLVGYNSWTHNRRWTMPRDK
mmetsp:Transcript_27223/g.63767  ORF Transcript_27223/g.63767 Transcript_27223/m.63767 type:complete len:614 (-) Transcript_27223:43-1884(-)